MQMRSISLQTDFANYWPSMNNTAFLVVSTDQCDRGSF